MRPDSDVSRSKVLSLVLRHRPDLVEAELDPHGWVPVPTLLDALAAHGRPMTRADLERVVQTNDKQRFELDTGTDRIRARQGHSVPVDLGLEPAKPPEVLFHGTPVGNLDSVLATGLDRRERHHVHLSADVSTAHRVGARRGRHVVLAVAAGAMARAGHRFWQTANGVWLTEAVPREHLRVVDDGAPEPGAGVSGRPVG